MMTDRANAAQTLYQHRQFPIGAALNEAFKAPEFDDVQTGLFDMIVFIQEQSHLAMTFDTGYGINDDPLQVGIRFGSFQMFVHDGILGKS
jgi:hypothetical protein